MGGRAARRTGGSPGSKLIARLIVWIPLLATALVVWKQQSRAELTSAKPVRSIRPGLRSIASWAWLLVPAWAVGIFLIINYVLPGGLSASANIYVVQPILWLSLAAVVLLLARYVSRVELPFSGFLVAVAALAGVFHLALLVLAGVMLGFGNSPYGHTPWIMAQNCLYVGSALIGVELSRAYIVAVVGKRSTFLALVSASLLFTVIAIPMAKFTTVGGLEDGAELAGGTVLPTASENLLASFLALVGGPVASIAYRGVLEAFEWFSPILPDLTWMTTALVGTLAPAAGLLIVRGLSAPEAGEESEAEAGPAPSLAPWMIAAFAAVALLWFNTGMLGVNPHVISGHSMQPEFDLGDMVITRDVSPASIEEGDVIWFRQDGINVIHRVMEVRSERGETLFITQGDNNNAPDHQPVAANQVEGKVILVVPKIGWLSIGIRNLIGYVGNVPLPINRASEEPGQAQQEPAEAPVGDSAGSQAAEDAQSAAGEEPTSRPSMPTIEYEVQPGDSLIDIAARFGITVEALTQLNGLEEPNAILYGSTLNVPYVGEEPGDATADVSR